MFEEYTYEEMLKQAISNADKDIDTREGSIFLDAVSPCMLMLAICFNEAAIMYEQLQLKTAQGENLDIKGSERLVDRPAATKAEYAFIYEGTAPPIGTSFRHDNGLYFVLQQYENSTYYLESRDTGTANNDILQGDKAIPIETFTDLRSAKFGALLVPARDEAADDEYRQIIYDNLIPGENGNVQHYKNWCKEADEGVNHARIIPLYGGPNTVLGIIIAADGTAASPELLAKVQSYVDPDNDGDGWGDGLGEGVANIGAHFRCVAPSYATIPITMTGVKLKNGYSSTEAAQMVSECVKDYFRQLSLTEEDNIVVYASEVGSKIQALDCMIGYSSISLALRGNPNVYQQELLETDIPRIGRIDLDGTLLFANTD